MHEHVSTLKVISKYLTSLRNLNYLIVSIGYEHAHDKKPHNNCDVT